MRSRAGAVPYAFSAVICALIVEASFPSLEIEVVRMLESIVELLGALSFSAVTALIGACIVGSIVTALRAVSRGSASVSTKK